MNRMELAQARDGWPKGGSPLHFEAIADPILKAIRFAYRLERQNGRKSIPWSGPEIGWQEQACCPKIGERLKAGNLAYAEEDQGRDPLTEIVSAAIQLGIEQGRRLARSSASKLLDEAYGSVLTLRVGHDSTQLHIQSGSLADPASTLERAIDALRDEQQRLARCPQYRRHAAALLERLSSSEVTDEEVERVARAIYEATEQPYGWDDAPPISYRKVALDQARAAITAMRSAATSERKG